MNKRKPSYEQALALEQGQAAAKRAAKVRAAAAPAPLSDESRMAFMRTFSTEALERRVTSRHTPGHDKRAMRAVLAERAA
jgi:hypothetical protein